MISFEEYANIGQMPFATFTRATANMSGAALRRAQAQHEIALDKWLVGRNKARKKYAELVNCGKIRPPTRTQRLMQRARGHSDRQDVQAARRVLVKQGLSW